MAEDAPGQGRTKQGSLCWKCAACPQMVGQWCLLPGTRYVSSERNHVSYKCKRLQTKGESKRPKKRNFRGYSMTGIDSKRGAVQVLSSRVSENTHSKVHAVKSQRWCIYLVLMEPTPPLWDSVPLSYLSFPWALLSWKKGERTIILFPPLQVSWPGLCENSGRVKSHKVGVWCITMNWIFKWLKWESSDSRGLGKQGSMAQILWGWEEQSQRMSLTGSSEEKQSLDSASSVSQFPPLAI